MSGNIPSTWYKYEFPLPEVPNAPKPSKADYSPENVAWLIEFFAGILGKSTSELTLQYENNTPSIKEDDILVSHPGDKLYFEDTQGKPKSPELIRYEAAAKKSKRLKLFQDNSPANIYYFQPLD